MLKTFGLHRTLEREQFAVLAGVALLTALSWLHIVERVESAGSMTHVHAQTWTLSDLGLSFIMWSIMMVGMMLPSALRMVLTFAALNRCQAGPDAFGRTWLFVLGYILVWTGYSAMAAIAQGAAQGFALWSAHHIALGSPAAAGGLLIAAGLFEQTPLRRIVRRCLEKSAHERFQGARDLGFALDAIAEVDTEAASSRAGAAEPTCSIAVLPSRT